MSDPSFAHLALLHTMDGLTVPPIAYALAGGEEPELVWRNDLNGLTFRIGDHFLKWNPRSTGIDLERECVRLEWIAARHPAPRVADYGTDGDAQWLLTDALPGRLRGRRPVASPSARSDPRHRGRTQGHPRHTDRRLSARLD